MNSKRKLLIIILTINYNLIFSYTKPDKIIFVSSRSKSNPKTQLLIQIYTEAFRRMGIKFELLDVPPRRAVMYADSGKVDGDVGRIYSYSDKHPTLVRVKQNIVTTIFSAYSTNKNMKLNNWNSLKNTKYKIEYRLGIKGSETALKKIVKPENLSVSSDLELAIHKLIKERTDIYIDLKDYVEEYINSEKFKKLNKKVYEVGIMEKTTTHPYLHKKHKELVLEFSNVLSEMKKEGLFQKYADERNLKMNW